MSDHEALDRVREQVGRGRWPTSVLDAIGVRATDEMDAARAVRGDPARPAHERDVAAGWVFAWAAIGALSDTVREIQDILDDEREDG